MLTQRLSLPRLSCQRNSPVGFIKNWDFSYRLPGRQGFVDFTVTAVAGHLTSSDFGPEHRKWNSCDPFALFEAPILHSISDVSAEIGPRVNSGTEIDVLQERVVDRQQATRA